MPQSLLYQTLIDYLTDGVLAETDDRRILAVNGTFCRIFGLPVQPLDLVGANASGTTERCKTQLADPEAFARRLEELAASRHPVNELVQFADGRVFELGYQPITHAVKGFVGHVWKYRAVSSAGRRKARRMPDPATTSMSSNETAITSEDAMAYLKVSKRTLYRLIEREGLPTLRVGRQFRFRRSEIDAWLATRGDGIAH